MENGGDYSWIEVSTFLIVDQIIDTITVDKKRQGNNLIVEDHRLSRSETG